ncbi:MAG: lipopolysaccharide biosynthesis protein [Bacteroidetes bacterium]|nr:lipopolysaccharide biosynthesis protein [Fibrella sp.]
MTDFSFPTSDLTPDRVVSLLWSRRLFLAKMGLIFGVIGVTYAFLAPVEYTTEARIMPELQARLAANLKRFGALAELAGIDIQSANTTEAVRPDLYPDVLTSTPFLLAVLGKPVTTTNKKRYPTLLSFLTASTANPIGTWLNDGPLILPKVTPAGWLVRMSKEQEDLLKDLRERIVSDLDKQSGLILIRVKMPDAEVAAQVCQYAIDYLTQYVVDYRVGKTRKDLTFFTERLREAKTRYTQALVALSAYSDQNRFVYTQAARVEGKRLEAEHDLSQSLYSELSRQYEQTRIRVQEETPILTVLEPPKVSARRSEPRRTLTVLIFAGLGFLAGVGWIFGGTVVSRTPTSGGDKTAGRGRPGYGYV